MNSRANIHKFMNMGKEAKFVLFASVSLLTAMLLPLIEVYWWGIALSVSAVVAMLMAMYEVRLRVRLLTMPFVLLGAIAVTTCAHEVIWGSDTGSADADVDAQIFSSRLLARCPLIGPVIQTEEGRKAKALFERDGDRLDDMRILPWRSYQDRHRRCEVLARLGASFGMIVPLAIVGLHVWISVLCVMTTWKLKKGVYRTAAGWMLAILILPWINTLFGSGPVDPDEDPLFVVPEYLPFINEMPELLLASVVQLGVFVAAVRHGWYRQERVPGFGQIKDVICRCVNTTRKRWCQTARLVAHIEWRRLPYWLKQGIYKFLATIRQITLTSIIIFIVWLVMVFAVGFSAQRIERMFAS